MKDRWRTVIYLFVLAVVLLVCFKGTHAATDNTDCCTDWRITV